MPSILLIEDDDAYREVFANALVEHGYAVTQADDGEKGVKLFRTAPTDLVITDIVMPNKPAGGHPEDLAVFPRLARCDSLKYGNGSVDSGSAVLPLAAPW